MKIIEPSAHIVNTDSMPRVNMMETCGRICYKSEDKITRESAIKFIKGVFEKKHGSVGEFAILTLAIEANSDQIEIFTHTQHKYLTIDRIDNNTVYITGTVRAWREVSAYFDCFLYTAIIYHLREKYPIFFNDINIDVPSSKLIGDVSVVVVPVTDVDTWPTYLKLRHRWVMVKYIVNRAVSHELVRHRPVSWLQESQRYCRYSEDKFGGGVTFISPRAFFQECTEDQKISVEWATWYQAMYDAEDTYLELLKTASPQTARTVLPNSCKTELVQLCNLEEWEIFFGLRTTVAAEPSMRQVTIPLYSEFKARWPQIFNEEI